MQDLLLNAFYETLLMVVVSGSLAIFIGFLIGVMLYLTDRNGLMQQLWVHHILGIVVNLLRSIPFIILMLAVTPLTRYLAGSSIGTMAAIVPLTIAAIPFFARQMEIALHEVDHGLIEMAQSIGATHLQIIIKILLPEALPSLIAGIVITLVALVGYSAMAGAIGGGGLGDLAIRYGYQRFMPEVMYAVVAILVVCVQIMQLFGDYLIRKTRQRKISRV